jgi:DNA-binding response OmpR family regulator
VRILHIDTSLRPLVFARQLFESFAESVETVDVEQFERTVSPPGPEADLLVIARDPWMFDDTTLCRQLHAMDLAVPVLALSGPCGPRRRAAALRAGADDFLSIPFDIDEVVAHVVALVRRASTRARQARAGPFCVDFARRQIAVEGRAVPLTLREFDVLATLVDHVGAVVARRCLVGRADPSAGELKAIDVHMSRIRDKIGAHGRLIETVRGVGYRLRT